MQTDDETNIFISHLERLCVGGKFNWLRSYVYIKKMAMYMMMGLPAKLTY